MDENLNSFLDKCRCCLEEITLAKIEIDNLIVRKYFEMTQLNLATSNLLPSFICVDCYEILISYSDIRTKFIENHQKLEEKFVQNETYELIEEEEACIEYEEIEVKVEEQGYTTDLHEIIEEIPVEEISYSEKNEKENEDSEEEEELKLEDIVKPEFLHYCLPKNEPENRKSKISQKSYSVKENRNNKKNDFMCEECGKLFTNPVSVKQHITLVHRKIKFNCDVENCGRVFTTQLHLSKHKAAFHNNSNTIPCHICNKRFHSKTELNSHMNSLHPDGNNEEYKCEICQQYLISFKVYQNHMKKHREGKYNCEICDKKFTNKIHLNNHLEMHRNIIES
ncbi:hypothetical protein PVAND_014112 [Polypedilum vanderplanki]|uniref:Zinc finger protein n=1 Tax=Polypedilum vanderplanki TaxID=319348 RepID=A0A9J6CT63_POLVA|nr:hypothetical protein PVAND_014112 [Polypedilum vanderplanki]